LPRMRRSDSAPTRCSARQCPLSRPVFKGAGRFAVRRGRRQRRRRTPPRATPPLTPAGERGVPGTMIAGGGHDAPLGNAGTANFLGPGACPRAFRGRRMWWRVTFERVAGSRGWRSWRSWHSRDWCRWYSWGALGRNRRHRRQRGYAGNQWHGGRRRRRARTLHVGWRHRSSARLLQLRCGNLLLLRLLL
jgi:hypothetical protein